VCCHKDDQLIGFVNVAWDGGVHASVFDTSVHPDFRLQGVGTALVQRAIEEAASRGAAWLHVDFEPYLAHFYQSCGFRPTEAGLIRLSE
jgi:GNAT superfamily N-acetyltransferase